MMNGMDVTRAKKEGITCILDERLRANGVNVLRTMSTRQSAVL